MFPVNFTQPIASPFTTLIKLIENIMETIMKKDLAWEHKMHSTLAYRLQRNQNECSECYKEWQKRKVTLAEKAKENRTMGINYQRGEITSRNPNASNYR